MPSGPRSSASERTIASMPPFDVTYAVRLRIARIEVFDPRNTTTPFWRVTGFGSCFRKNRLHAICVTWKPPSRFTFRTSSIWSVVISSGVPCPRPWFAALFTRMSRRPAFSSITSKRCFTCAASETSHGTAVKSPMFRARRICSPFAVDAGVEPHMNTCAPSRTNRSTISMPVFRFPPVTSTTFPSKRFIFISPFISR